MFPRYIGSEPGTEEACCCFTVMIVALLRSLTHNNCSYSLVDGVCWHPPVTFRERVGTRNTLRARLNVTPMETPPGFDHTVCRTLYGRDPTRTVCCPRPSAERAAVANQWATCLPSYRACRIQVHRVNAQPDSFSSQPSCTVPLCRFTHTFAVSRVITSSSIGVTVCLAIF